MKKLLLILTTALSMTTMAVKADSYNQYKKGYPINFYPVYSESTTGVMAGHDRENGEPYLKGKEFNCQSLTDIFMASTEELKVYYTTIEYTGVAEEHEHNILDNKKKFLEKVNCEDLLSLYTFKRGVVK